MKRWIIGSVIGAIIVFAWQAASWMFLGVHDDSMKYHPAQNEIMNVISANTAEEGLYMLPYGATKEEQEKVMQEMEGKPWATLIYHKSHSNQMTTQLIRGFLVDLVLVLLLVIILTKGGMPGFSGFFTGSLAVGAFTFLWGPYTGHIWFGLPWHMIRGDMIDAVAAWGLCGLWLGWWMNRK